MNKLESGGDSDSNFTVKLGQQAIRRLLMGGSSLNENNNNN